MNAADMDEDGIPTAWSSPTLVATDQDSNVSQLIWELKTPPVNGNATLQGSGASPSALSYEPEANYYGQDSFVIRVYDSLDVNASDEITINVTVVPQEDDPKFASVAPVFGVKGVPYSYAIQASDPDGLSGLLVTASGTLPSWLSMTSLGDGSAILAGTPQAADIGFLEVSLVVTDPVDRVATQSFTINVIGENTAPVIAQGSEVSVVMDEDGSPVAWQVPVLSASDADGHPLKWSLVSSPSNGVAEVSGSGSSPTVLNYVPDGNFTGSDLELFVRREFHGFRQLCCTSHG